MTWNDVVTFDSHRARRQGFIYNKRLHFISLLWWYTIMQVLPLLKTWYLCLWFTRIPFNLPRIPLIYPGFHCLFQFAFTICSSRNVPNSISHHWTCINLNMWNRDASHTFRLVESIAVILTPIPFIQHWVPRFILKRIFIKCNSQFYIVYTINDQCSFDVHDNNNSYCLKLRL